MAKILRGEFVDMAEDNLEVQFRGTLQDPSALSTTSQPKCSRREIPYLMSWVQCFGKYIAVVASKYPDRVQQLLTYQTLIVCEARRYGWLAYDTTYCQQVVRNQATDCSKLKNSYAVTFMAQGIALACITLVSALRCIVNSHHFDTEVQHATMPDFYHSIGTGYV